MPWCWIANTTSSSTVPRIEVALIRSARPSLRKLKSAIGMLQDRIAASGAKNEVKM